MLPDVCNRLSRDILEVESGKKGDVGGFGLTIVHKSQMIKEMEIWVNSVP